MKMKTLMMTAAAVALLLTPVVPALAQSEDNRTLREGGAVSIETRTNGSVVTYSPDRIIVRGGRSNDRQRSPTHAFGGAARDTGVTSFTASGPISNRDYSSFSVR